MDELVARLVAAGLSSAVFTYFAVRMWVKPRIEESEKPVRRPKFRVNVATGVIAVLFSFVLMTIIHWQFIAWEPGIIPLALEALMSGVIAAAVATYGHEAIKNFGKGDTIMVGDISDSKNVAVGDDAKAGQ